MEKRKVTRGDVELILAVLYDKAEAEKRRRNSTSGTMNKIHEAGRKNTSKGEAGEALKEYGFSWKQPSKKPIRFMVSSTSTVEAASSSSSNISNLESSLREDDKVLNIKKRKRSCLMLKRAYNFKEDEEHVARFLYNLARSSIVRNGWNNMYEVVNFTDVLKEQVPNRSSNKKQKNSKGCCGNKRNKPKQPLSMGIATNSTPPPPPDLPQEFKNKIIEMGGNEITLILQKSLYNSDLSQQQNRLSMPLKQIKNGGFLRQGELQVLEKKQAIQVPLIQPSLEITKMALAKWDMPKSSGLITSSYVLRSSWIKVAVANQLKENDVIQVWSFRVQEELCMALVKV